MLQVVRLREYIYLYFYHSYICHYSRQDVFTPGVVVVVVVVSVVVAVDAHPIPQRQQITFAVHLL